MSFQRGWSLFILGLLLSAFLGGAIRVFFSPVRIRGWIENLVAQRQPKFTFEFDEAKLTLADGIIPQLAIEFKNLKIKAKDECFTKSELKIARTNVPFNFSSLTAKKMGLGHLVLDDAEFRFKPANCNANFPNILTKKNPSIGMRTPQLSVKDLLERRWKSELENTTQIVKEFSLGHLKVFLGDSVDPIFEVHNFNARINEKLHNILFEGEVLAGFGFTGGEALGSFHGTGEMGMSGLHLAGRGNLKEGQYSLTAQWDVLAEKFSTKLKLKDVPMKNGVALLDRWGLVRWPDFAPRHQWVSCDLNTEGNSTDWQASETGIENCSFYGDLGRWSVRSGNMKILKGEMFPLMVQVHGMKAKEFAIAQGWSEYLSYFVQAGLVDFNFDFLGKDHFRLSGLWKDPIFQYLSKAGDKNSIFAVSQYQFAVEKNDKIIGVDIRDIIWTEGRSEGLLRAEKNRLTDEWALSWNLSTDIIPGIFNKWAGINSIERFKSTGDLKYAAGAIESGRASVSSEKLSAPDIEVNALSLDLRVLKGQGSLTAQLQLVDFTNKEKFRSWRSIAPEFIDQFNDVRATTRFDFEGRWQIDALKAKASDAQVEFVGRGFKLNIDQSIIRIRQKSDQKWKSWQAFGTLLEPRLELAN